MLRDGWGDVDLQGLGLMREAWGSDADGGNTAKSKTATIPRRDTDRHMPGDIGDRPLTLLLQGIVRFYRHSGAVDGQRKNWIDASLDPPCGVSLCREKTERCD